MKKIAIILLNYNNSVDTIDCLADLTKVKTSDFRLEIWIVDYGPKAEGLKIARRFSQSKIIRKEENLGFAKANNVGAKTALAGGADYICLLNNDTLLPSNFLEKLYKYMENNPKIGAVSPKIYFAKGHEFHLCRYKKSQLGKVIWYAGGQLDWHNMLASHRGVDKVNQGQFEEIFDTDFISGCCVLIRKDVFEKVGFLQEKLFMYWEDVDFSQRIKKAGWQIKYLPSSYIWHKNAGSSGVGSDLHDYFLTRNRLWFGFKYAPCKTKLALFRQSINALFKASFWQKQAIKDFYLNKMGIGSWPKKQHE